MSMGRSSPSLTVATSDPNQGPGRPRSSSGRALTWDGRNPAVRLPPVLMEELELMSHGVAVVRRKSKVTYADIIAWLLDQCPEQVAQVKAMCPPETRAKFVPRSDLGSPPPPQMLTPPPALPGSSGQMGSDGTLAITESQMMAAGMLPQQGAMAAGRGGSVHWLVPPNLMPRYSGTEGDLVDNTMVQPEAMLSGTPAGIPVQQQQQQRMAQGRKQQSQQQLLQQQLQQQPPPQVSAVQVPTAVHVAVAAPASVPQPIPQHQPSQPQPQQPQPQQPQPQQQQQHPQTVTIPDTDPEATDVDITIDDAADNDKPLEKVIPHGDPDVDIVTDVPIDIGKRSADGGATLPPKKAKVVEITAKETGETPAK